MLRTLAAATLLAGLSAGALAATAQLGTDTIAVAEGRSDITGDTGLAGSVPLVTSAAIVGTLDFASAGAIAAEGLFNTSAEAYSTASFASGVGAVSYASALGNATGVWLHFDFATNNGSTQTGYAITSFTVRIEGGSGIVFEQLIDTAGVFDFAVVLAGPSQLSFQLASEASTLTGGSAFASGLLSYAVTAVPEPGAGLMLAAGLLLVASRRQFARPGRRA